MAVLVEDADNDPLFRESTANRPSDRAPAARHDGSLAV
jgi:hypothetical protein